ncbi:hypothetical protein ACE6H2_019147 [Prunus campanulata]
MFHFHPTDQKLVGFFLYKFLVERKPLMPPYHNLKRLTPKHMDRRVGQGGTWSEIESSKLRNFCYKNQGSEDHTRWLPDEYSLFDGPKNDYTDCSYDFDFVICRMRKNDRAEIKETNLKRPSHDQVQKTRSTNKNMKKDHQMGSTESSSHVQQGFYSSLTGVDLVRSYDVDPSYPTLVKPKKRKFATQVTWRM